MTTLPSAYRERDRERERLRRGSETEEDEERERVLDEVSDGDESDDTAYDRRHTIPPSDLPWLDLTSVNLFLFSDSFPHFTVPPRCLSRFQWRSTVDFWLVTMLFISDVEFTGLDQQHWSKFYFECKFIDAKCKHIVTFPRWILKYSPEILL